MPPKVVSKTRTRFLTFDSLWTKSPTTTAYANNVLLVANAVFDVHVYQPAESDVLEEFSNGQRGDDDEVTAAGVHELPNRSFDGLWDTSVLLSTCAL